MISTKITSLYLVNTGHLRAKYEIYPSWISWDNMFTWFNVLTCPPPDCKWPLISTEDHCLLALNMRHSHTTYEFHPRFPCLRYHDYNQPIIHTCHHDCKGYCMSSAGPKSVHAARIYIEYFGFESATVSD